jgi:hypothetical protein
MTEPQDDAGMSEADLIRQTDNSPRPEDGPQDNVSQDPSVAVESDAGVDAEY